MGNLIIFCYSSLKSLYRLHLLTVILFIPLNFSTADLLAQENPVRPALGLVLSGGGAHGIAQQV